MGYQVLITERAQSDLQSIAEHIAVDNPASAIRFTNKLLDEAFSLGHSPQRGKLFVRKLGVRRIVCRPYLVYYRVETDSNIVRVLRFWHGFRHPKTPRFEE